MNAFFYAFANLAGPSTLKIKSLPQDFVVEEVSQLPLKGGNFAIYRLEKTRIGTLEALSQLAATWNIPRSQIGYCGLKDRHAITTQLISINHGPEQSTAAETWHIDFIGKAKSELTAKHLSGNQFTVVIRDLNETSSEQLRTIN